MVIRRYVYSGVNTGVELLRVAYSTKEEEGRRFGLLIKATDKSFVVLVSDTKSVIFSRNKGTVNPLFSKGLPKGMKLLDLNKIEEVLSTVAHDPYNFEPEFLLAKDDESIQPQGDMTLTHWAAAHGAVIYDATIPE